MQKGDNVSVLDEAIDGVVISVHNNHITIETTDGFMMTYFVNELVKINNTNDLSESIRSFNPNKIKVSGLLVSHYSPKAKVILNQIPETGCGFIALANVPTPEGAIRLDSPITIEDYARNLYEALRRGDKYGLKHVIVIEPDGPGLAKAIRDRVGKAAAGN